MVDFSARFSHTPTVSCAKRVLWCSDLHAALTAALAAVGGSTFTRPALSWAASLSGSRSPCCGGGAMAAVAAAGVAVCRRTAGANAAVARDITVGEGDADVGGVVGDIFFGLGVGGAGEFLEENFVAWRFSLGMVKGKGK